jgi:hypothetical protein
LTHGKNRLSFALIGTILIIGDRKVSKTNKPSKRTDQWAMVKIQIKATIALATANTQKISLSVRWYQKMLAAAIIDHKIGKIGDIIAIAS